MASAALFVAGVVGADEPGDEADELEALLEVISEETEIATKTRMNADYVPGIVSVLDGDKLAAYGARTVWEALQFVPGVEPSMDRSGTPTLTVRGIPFPFNSGSVHLLINGATIARESTGINGAALLLPIEQVERIEFIRGPGSVIYGDFAFQGLVNIITRGDQRAVTVGGDSEGTQYANLSYSAGESPWQVAFNVAPMRRDQALLPEGTRGDEQRLFANLAFTWGRFSLQAQSVNRDVDRSSGTPVRLFDESSNALGLRYDHDASDTLQLRARLDHLDNEVAIERNSFAGEQTTLALDAIHSGFSNQVWLAGVAWSDGAINRATHTPPLPPGSPPRPPLQIGKHARSVGSVYLQDQITVTPELTLTVGARYDDNEEIGSRLTPRAAAVWQFAPGHVLKAQYAEGFRSPTYFELYTDGTNAAPLDFEVNRTTEVSYVHQRVNTSLRLTLYNARIDDMVFRDARVQRFLNVAEADSRGFEFEFNHQLTPTLRIDTHYSHNHSEHNRNAQLVPREIGAAADWLGQFATLWQPRNDSTLALRYLHVGPRSSAPLGRREYGVLNLSWSERGLCHDNLDLRISLDNALHEPSTYLATTPAGDSPIAFQDRRLWADLTWRW